MRNLALAALCAAACALPAGAADEGHWINLFDGETTFGWTSIGDAKWSVKDKVLTGESGTGGMIATTSRFQDFELTAKIRVKAECSTGLAVRAGLDGHPAENGSGVIWISEAKGSKSPWHEISVKAQGNKLEATVDGKSQEISSTNARGYVALLYHHNGGAVVELSEAKLRPLGGESIFNGKDLQGWNIIPERKSVFSVVDGALNIKNGNGQIETAKTWKDFTLQLDIFSNGEHLNSGVFYRGPVGEFWKGYESQVRNQWEGDDRTKPVDFGTGGNYGNQASRKVVSSDKEWFQKTIVTDGNHTSVWINGYQASDFYDTRPVNNQGNGKVGYVPGPGTIHLQGHDPTTDLSFKNIVLQSYDK